jgi:hypothetical protein
LGRRREATQGADRGDKQFLAIRRQALDPLIDKLTALLSQSQEKGEVAQDLHPYLGASALVSILEKLCAYVRTLRHLNAVSNEIEASNVMTSLVNGSSSINSSTSSVLR